jgi:hypothetical protein
VLNHSVTNFRRLFGSRVPHAFMTLGLVLAALLAFSPAHVSAKAPPLATIVFNTTVYATPELNGTALGTIASGSEVELTGDAAPGYLAIYYGESVGWVPSQYLSLGERPGIDTAVAVVDTPLLDAPMHGADVLETVPRGDAVILTGATVDGYDAASHAGAGGWLDRRDIAR